MRTTKYSLTPEHRAQLKPHNDRWIAVAMRTEVQTDADREAARSAIRGLYRSAQLAPPANEVFCASPTTALLAGAMASGVWWLRDHPDRHAELFGRVLGEHDYRSAIHEASARLHGVRRPAVTRDATDDATRVATNDATSAATRDATDDATRDATSDATNDATSDATNLATRLATNVATNAATSAATNAATAVATNAATEVATNDATRVATHDATRVATNDATNDATSAATRDATNDATNDATSDATNLATDDRLVIFLLRCTRNWSRLWNGGNQWAGWLSYLTFFRDVPKLELAEYAAFRDYEMAGIHAGPRSMHSMFWIASGFPEFIRIDERNRPHCLTGPSHRWADGRQLYYVNGTRVPRDMIEDRTSITISRIDAEANTEMRRIMIELYGVERYMRDAGAQLVDRSQWPIGPDRVETGELYRRGDTLAVRVWNGTREPDGKVREFWLPVHPELRPLPDPRDRDGQLGEPQALTALAAVASTYGLRAEEYVLEART
jgi:hypothetical protein